MRIDQLVLELEKQKSNSSLVPESTTELAEPEENARNCPHGEVWEYCKKCALAELMEINAEVKRTREEFAKQPKAPISEIWPQAKDYPTWDKAHAISREIMLMHGAAQVKLKRQIKLPNGLFVKRGTQVILIENSALGELEKRFEKAKQWRTLLDDGHHSLIYADGLLFLVPDEKLG